MITSSDLIIILLSTDQQDLKLQMQSDWMAVFLKTFSKLQFSYKTGTLATGLKLKRNIQHWVL